MKIAMICQPWDPMHPPVTSGSVAIWVYEVSRRLARSNEVTVYAQQQGGDAAVEHHDGVEYRRLPLGRTGRWPRLMHRLFGRASSRRPYFASPWFCKDFIKAIAREVRDRQYDVVHIQNYSQFVPIVRTLNPNVRIVLHMRCEWLLQLDRDMLLERVGQADLLVSVGRYLTSATISRFPDVSTTIMTLANGVDTTFFDSLPEGIDVERYQPISVVKELAAQVFAAGGRVDAAETTASAPVELHRAMPTAALGAVAAMSDAGNATTIHRQLVRSIRPDTSPDASPLLLFVSRISPEKGVHVLLDAFAAVRREFPDARLRLVGPPGALEPALMLEISDDPMIQSCAKYFRGDYLAMLKAQLSPEDAAAVEFTGHIPHDQLPDHYRNAALLVAPSLSEAFGRAVIEAMSCGVPVVGSRIGGIAETVRHNETGLLVSPNDAAALAEAIIALLRDPERRLIMGAHAWQRAHSIYSWDSIAAQTQAYYEAMLTGHAATQS